MTTIAGLLRLVRASIALSPVADGIAGAALAAAAGASSEPRAVAWGLLGSLGLFLFGMAQNDVADRKRDAALGRGRPLATGAVSLLAARSVLCGTLALVAASAAFGAPAARPYLLALLALISAYNLAPGHLGVAGPAALGGIRAQNLLLGAAAAGSVHAALAPALLYFGYIASVSIAARMEDGELRLERRLLAASGAAALFFAAAAPFSVAARAAPPALAAAAAALAVAVIVFRAAPALRSALAVPSGPAVARLAGVFLSSIFLFDAALAAAAGNLAAAGLLAALFPLSRALSRRFPPS